MRLAEGSPLRATVFAQIRLGWSPQQISGRLKLVDQSRTVSHIQIIRPSMFYRVVNWLTS